ncbi:MULTISPECIES: hypothetical protein [Gammaproteobacteria]|uniref:DNA-binding protein n=3 Tax=Gammaproteobacteria TaxID=1236 RepID=A0AAX3NZN3_9GAMM|nr:MULTISPECIES: hypothetical protein [Gammaproteobacteria]MDV0844421.1 hypothetical protein [Klebsiella quasipneumoniae subsp. quasipneumoniae]WED79224.1 hypothetical protein PYU98_25045 [Aeromonas allosaccharophila]
MTSTSKANGPFHQIIRGKGWTLVEVGLRWGIKERQMSRIANSAKQRDLDAANGLPLNDKNASKMVGEPMHQHIRGKGWTLTEVGERWGVAKRQMSRIVKAGKPKDLDAATGLPHQDKSAK